MTFDEVTALLAPRGAIQSIMSHEERRYIWDCVHAHKGRPAIEIGSAYGGTTILMAKAGAHPVWSVDNWTCGRYEEFVANTAKAGLGAGDLRIVREGSITAASMFSVRAFGVVLIDGDHGKASGGDDAVPYQDILAYAPKVIRGGWLLIDDTENGHPAVTAAVRRWGEETSTFVLDRVCHGDNGEVKLKGFQRVA